MLSGGHAENALPRTATATINCRIFPGNSVVDIMGELALVAGNPELEWAVYGKPVSSDTSPFNDEVMNAVEASLAQLYPGTPVIPRMISGTTDGAYFRAAGIPSYSLTGIFLNPKDSFAHGLNERVRRAMAAHNSTTRCGACASSAARRRFDGGASSSSPSSVSSPRGGAATKWRRVGRCSCSGASAGGDCPV